MNATIKQLDFVTILTKRLHLSPSWFAGYCIATYGAEPAGLDIKTCSALIGELHDWIEHPDQLLRAQGQAELFPMTGVTT